MQSSQETTIASSPLAARSWERPRRITIRWRRESAALVAPGWMGCHHESATDIFENGRARIARCRRWPRVIQRLVESPGVRASCSFACAHSCCGQDATSNSGTRRAHVAVHGWALLVEGDRSDRAGGVVANAGRCAQVAYCWSRPLCLPGPTGRRRAGFWRSGSRPSTASRRAADLNSRVRRVELVPATLVMRMTADARLLEITDIRSIGVVATAGPDGSRRQ
jgi:hypothetical protein